MYEVFTEGLHKSSLDHLPPDVQADQDSDEETLLETRTLSAPQAVGAAYYSKRLNNLKGCSLRSWVGGC